MHDDINCKLLWSEKVEILTVCFIGLASVKSIVPNKVCRCVPLSIQYYLYNKKIYGAIQKVISRKSDV